MKRTRRQPKGASTEEELKRDEKWHKIAPQLSLYSFCVLSTSFFSLFWRGARRQHNLEIFLSMLCRAVVVWMLEWENFFTDFSTPPPHPSHSSPLIVLLFSSFSSVRATSTGCVLFCMCISWARNVEAIFSLSFFAIHHSSAALDGAFQRHCVDVSDVSERWCGWEKQRNAQILEQQLNESWMKEKKKRVGKSRISWGVRVTDDGNSTRCSEESLLAPFECVFPASSHANTRHTEASVLMLTVDRFAATLIPCEACVFTSWQWLYSFTYLWWVLWCECCFACAAAHRDKWALATFLFYLLLFWGWQLGARWAIKWRQRKKKKLLPTLSCDTFTLN